MNGRRSGEAQAALGRRAGPMKHRNQPRGGSRNEQADLLDEYYEEEEMTDREERCEAPNPTNDYGCHLQKGHTGMHQNFGSAPRESWIQGSKIGVRWRQKRGPQRPPRPKRPKGTSDTYEWWPDPDGGVDPETGYLKGKWVLS